ncbi:MAG: hypothetical protein IKP04_04790 [Candidatus Methanomethylophilaceae archaeon]|nr:hypothetical protein [Candidatus Methanomethylophilaceae archaeon]
MTIDEEMHRGWRREWMQEAIDSGEVIPVDKCVNFLVNFVSERVREGMNLQEALDLCVPQEIREKVQERFNNKQRVNSVDTKNEYPRAYGRAVFGNMRDISTQALSLS